MSVVTSYAISWFLKRIDFADDLRPAGPLLVRDGYAWVAAGEMKCLRGGWQTLNDWGAFVDDNGVMNGVTTVHPVDPQRPAFRDVLVVTLKALPGERGG